MVFCLEIIAGLWIGSSKLERGSFLERKKINYIVHADKDLSFLGKSKTYASHLQEEVRKFEQQKAYQYLVHILENISQRLEIGEKVLIVDNTGVSFSSLIVLAFLVKYGGLTLQQAIKSWNSKVSFGVKMTMECQTTLNNYYQKNGL